MDEARIRDVMQEAATSQLPRARVDVGLALRRGRARLRRRRAGQAGTPALAAVAVIALAIGVTSPAVPDQHPAGNPATASGPGKVAPPRRFNPLIPYLALRWLPHGQSVRYGEITPTFTSLVTGGNVVRDLAAYAAGQCDGTPQQLLRQLRHHQTPNLTCGRKPALGQVVGVAPAINGHRAFWVKGKTALVWEYARGSWAGLNIPLGHPPVAEVVKVADHARFDVSTRPTIEFPIQLTGLPAARRVVWMDYVEDSGLPRASVYSVATSVDAPGAPVVEIAPATSSGTAHVTCYVYPHGDSVRRTINGIKVIVSTVKTSQVTQEVCAPDDRGLMVSLTIDGHSRPDAVSVFAHHLRVLGSNPANWSMSPFK